MVKISLNKSETQAIRLIMHSYCEVTNDFKKNADMVLLTKFVIKEFFDQKIKVFCLPKDKNTFTLSESVAFSMVFMLTIFPMGANSFELLTANRVIADIHKQIINSITDLINKA